MKKTQYQKALKKHQDRIFSYSLYYLHNREDAEDVTQEVFIKLWQNWDHVDHKKMVPWLMRVTYHQCIDYIRKKKIRSEESIFSERINLNRMSLETEKQTPEQQCEFSDFQKHLISILTTLPEITQSILLMHYFQGMKYETIAVILDMNTNAVKVAAHRGKKSLKLTITEHYPEMIGRHADAVNMS